MNADIGKVLRLAEIRASDTALAGGKAARLGDLLALGFPVPPGFLITARAYREFIEEIDLNPAVAALAGVRGQDLAERCGALQQRVIARALPDDLSAAILEAHRDLVSGKGDDVRCAVRSSATAEDLASASFAGQHRTYYYVKGDQLLEVIRRCWASLWTVEAVTYRATHAVEHSSILMAVLVQEMIPSDVSGVAFTVHPVTGDRGEVVIESSWGMGAGLVDGRVTPDRYIVKREGAVIRERRIAEKRAMVPARLSGVVEARLERVPGSLQRAASLDDPQVRTVVEWSLKCETHFGEPQDVEWAFSGGDFHLLQSRPITTLGHKDPGGAVQGKWVLFKAIAENFTDPMTPLAVDLMSNPPPPGLRFIGGRVYMNLDFARHLIPLRISDRELADFLFMSSLASPRVSLARLPGALVAGIAFYLAYGVILARTRGMPDDFMDGFRELCRRIEADPSIDVDAAMRLVLQPPILEPIGLLPIIVNFASMRFMPWVALLKYMLRRWAPGVHADAAALLCTGSEGVLSAEMGREIVNLAGAAAAVPAVGEVLACCDPEQALERLRPDPRASDFLSRFDRFIATHGHRGLKEFQLHAPRWAENPAPVLGMVRNILVRGAAPAAGPHPLSPSPLTRRGGTPGSDAARVRAEVEGNVHAALDRLPFERPLGWRRRLVQLAAGRARYYFKLRENSRFYHIMGFGTLRKKILAAEAELLRDRKLRCKDDVFYLLAGELADLRAGRLGWLDVEGRIRERRIEFVRLSRMTPPRTIGIDGGARPETGAKADGDRLVGQSASPGCHTGIARVILDPSMDLSLEPGEVLVAPYTDPAWTPLFLTAGAAVVEIGSYLSHAGTVAREFGMPCVVDVVECTQRIQSGDRVHVDADHGTVDILERAAARR